MAGVRALLLADRLLVVLVLVAALALAGVALARHASWNSTYFDLSVFDQEVWSFAQGRPFQTSDLRFGVALAGHVSPVLVLFVPLYLAWPDPRALLCAQALAIASAAIPLYALALRIGVARWTALGLAVAYLVYPNVWWINVFDFHPDAFQLLLVPLALLALLAERRLFFFVICLLMVTIRENSAMPVVGLGMLALLRRESRWVGLACCALGGAWFLLSEVVLMPAYRMGAPALQLARYAQFGATPGAMATTLILRPDLALATILGSEQRLYLLQLLVPLAGLPLLGPALLLPAVPTLLGNLLSSYGPQHSITFHYSAAITGCLFAAAAQGTARIARWGLERVAAMLAWASVVIGGAVTIVAFGVLIGAGAYAATPRVAALQEAASLVAPGASVAVTNRVGPHLAERRQILYFPPGSHPSTDVAASEFPSWNAGDPEAPEFVLVELDDPYWRQAPGDLTPDEALDRFAPSTHYRTLFERDQVVLRQKVSR